MKKVILLSLFIGLVGCVESETGLQKNVINSAYESCTSNLKESLKSPSGLKLGVALITVKEAPYEAIISIYGEKARKENPTESLLTSENKAKFKGIAVLVDYEAQNSFGVMLKDTFTCGYIYNTDEKTVLKPYNLNREKITNPILLSDINVDKSSNIKLISGIKKVINLD